jgi:hypothetical protein
MWEPNNSIGLHGLLKGELSFFYTTCIHMSNMMDQEMSDEAVLQLLRVFSKEG